MSTETAPAESRDSEKRNAWIALTFTAALFAGQSVAGKSVLPFIAPATLAWARWLVIFFLVVPFAWRELQRERASLRANWRILLILGLLGTTLQNAIFLWGLHLSSAVNAAMLNSTIPIWILVLTAVIYSRRVALGEWVGVAVSLVGVLMIIFGGSKAPDGGLRFNFGDLILAFGMINWALYSSLLPRRPLHLSPWGYLSVLSVFGVVSGIPVVLAEAAMGFTVTFNMTLIVGLLYMTIPGAVVVTITYNYAIDKLGPAKAGFGTHLVPAWGMLLAFLLLGETPTWVAFGGLIVVLAGIGLGQTARR